MLFDVLEYFFSPRTLFTHLVGAGLLASLPVQGTAMSRLVKPFLLGEVVTLLLWWLIPEGWGAIIAVAFWIHLYERIIGPRTRVESNAVFLADQETSSVLGTTSPLVTFEAWTDNSNGDVYMTSTLRYAEHWKTYWGRPTGKHAVNINEISAVEEGVDFDIIKAIRKEDAETNNCFYVIVGDKLTVTYIAESKESRDQWVIALSRLIGDQLKRYKEAWMTRIIESANIADVESKGASLDQAVAVLQGADRPLDKAYARELFSPFTKKNSTKQASVDTNLPLIQLKAFLDLTIRRPEIQQIYDRLLKDKRGEQSLSPQRLKEFVADNQKETIPLHRCKQWIQQSEPVLPPHSLSSIGFTSFMLSRDQCIFNRDHQVVYQDMTKPLSHYFIATSHNTYLMKDQLKGKSSVEAYITAFKKSCRCVELDCWDGPNNEPIIYHGHTLTSKILFKDVIEAINTHAFEVSEYPVILSFENHCSIEQQKVMAAHLKTILGDKLYTKPIPEDETQLPSPEDLKGYVIVKAKKLKEGQEEMDDEYDSESDEESDDEDDTSSGGKDSPSNQKDKTESITQNGDGLTNGTTDHDKESSPDDKESSPEAKESSPEDKESSPEPKESSPEGEGEKKTSTLKKFGSITLGRKDSNASKKKPKKPLKIAQELSDMVFYCQAVHFRGFDHAKEQQKHYEMSSFGEKKAVKLGKEDSKGYIEFNKRQLSRIYPAGHRVDSSNYDPQPMWNVGCQLVALNYQTPARSMQLNQGMFQDNGKCGFVLKPKFMTEDDISFDPKGPFDEKKVKFLTIRIISGQQLPYSKEEKVKSERGMYVQVKISGVEADNAKFKTKTVKSNGYNPQWNELLSFKIHVPELAIVSLIVKDGDNFMAQYSLPFRCMQQGYRRVPLQTKASDDFPHASLFVHVEMKDDN